MPPILPPNNNDYFHGGFILPLIYKKIKNYSNYIVNGLYSEQIGVSRVFRIDPSILLCAWFRLASLYLFLSAWLGLVLISFSLCVSRSPCCFLSLLACTAFSGVIEHRRILVDTRRAQQSSRTRTNTQDQQGRRGFFK